MAEDYKRLLIAINNTDEYENKKSVICVYDMKENENIVGIFNSSKSCADFFQTTYKNIDSYVCKKELRYGRFLLERVPMR